MNPVMQSTRHKWQTFVSQFEAIRTRMLFAFIAVTLLPFAGLIFVYMLAGAQGGQREAIQRLETVLSYKENSIQSWSQSLNATMRNVRGNLNEIENLQAFLNPESSEAENAAAQQSPSPEWIENVRAYLTALLLESPEFNEFMLLTAKGEVLVATNQARQGQDYAQMNFYRVGRYAPYLDAPYYSEEAQQTEMFAAYPLIDPGTGVFGVLVGKVNLTLLTQILLDRTGLGESGVTYLVGQDRRILVGMQPEIHGTPIHTEVILAAFEGQQTSEMAYEDLNGTPVVGSYHWLANLNSILVAEMTLAEATKEAYGSLAVNVSVALASIMVAIFIALLVTRSISLPIRDLADTATQIASGNRALRVREEFRDEIGILGRAFNSMTAQLNALITGLEQRVAERTMELEERSSYLEASSQVSQATTSILDLNQLFNEAVELIRRRFGLYYVGIFLADEANQWAVLQAGTGEAGQAMLKRKHRLPIGSASMIGWCIANNRARIAQIAEEDSVRLATPELPLTRSEAALPLRSRGRVIGAITVQSDRPNAFNETALAVLQSMADQLAIAIDNARFFEESRQALEAERRAYGIKTATAWLNWLQPQRRLSFRGSTIGVTPTDEPWSEAMLRAYQEGKTVISGADFSEQGDDSSSLLAMPIKVRGNTVAVIQIRKSQGSEHASWSKVEIEALEKVCDQLGLALDSARLYAETQQQADQERLISEITNRIRATLDLDTMLQTAVREMRHALRLAEVEIRLGMGNGALQRNAPHEV